MFNLLISIGVATLITLAVGIPLGQLLYGIIPGVIVAIALFMFLGRVVSRKIEAIGQAFFDELQVKNQARPDPARVERAVEILKTGYRYRHWHFMVGSMLDGQIGMAYYANKQFEKSEPYLIKSAWRHWVAKSMLGVTHYKKRRYEPMKEVFEKALKWNRKESFLWNLYAYCLTRSGDRNGAVDVLSRGLEVLPGDARIENNRSLVQKNKKMKMRSWDQLWYQFHLDTPPMPKMQMDRRGLYKGR
jgi:tetratricopeptide (TPR) repeat protein